MLKKPARVVTLWTPRSLPGAVSQLASTEANRIYSGWFSIRENHTLRIIIRHGGLCEAALENMRFGFLECDESPSKELGSVPCAYPAAVLEHSLLRSPSAKTLYARGQTAEAKDDPITAYEDYYQAWKKEPKNLRYKTAYERLRFLAASAHVNRGEKLRAQGDITAAFTEFLRALEIDPSNELAHQDIQNAQGQACYAQAQPGNLDSRE